MSIRKYFLTASMMILLLTLCACAENNGQAETSTPPAASSAQNEQSATSPGTPSTTQQPGDMSGLDTPTNLSGEVVISFDYERQSGAASNQYAVWIEDIDGKLIKTLYATAYTAKGGYKNRPDSIALWVEKSGRASMTDAEVDAISGATPRAGTQTYTWDLTDTNSVVVSPGEYRFVVEGTLRWKNYVLYSGLIEVGDTPNTVQADAEFVYEATDRYAALTNDSPENSMIGAATASFIPNSGN